MNKQRLYFLVCTLMVIPDILCQISVMISVSSRYEFNFWENIEGFSRENGSNNIGYQFNMLGNYRNIGVKVGFHQITQEYHDISQLEVIPPWKIQSRNYTSLLQGYQIGCFYNFRCSELYSVQTSTDYCYQVFKWCKVITQFGDGVTSEGSVKINDLNSRQSLQTSLAIYRRTKLGSLHFRVGQIGVLNKLNKRITPPITTFESNSRNAIYLDLGLNISIYRQNE